MELRTFLSMMLTLWLPVAAMACALKHPRGQGSEEGTEQDTNAGSVASGGMNPSGRTLKDWLTSTSLTPEEALAVKIIVESAISFGGLDPEISREKLASWIDGHLDTLDLQVESTKRISIQPILACTKLKIVSAHDSNLSQEDVNQLVSKLPRLTFIMIPLDRNCAFASQVRPSLRCVNNPREGLPTPRP